MRNLPLGNVRSNPTSNSSGRITDFPPVLYLVTPRQEWDELTKTDKEAQIGTYIYTSLFNILSFKS